MKPVAIVRHSASEGPAYFATYLERRSIPWQLIALDAGEPVPRDVAGFSGLALMGGPMSANDPLPWIAPVLELIRDAVRRDVPAIGHCLGAQLMSKAFGGAVRASAVREIGWGEVRALREPGLCARQAFRHAVPCRDDRRAGPRVAAQRRRRAQEQRGEPGRAAARAD
jgi:GMP synthase-like glutamine amidotransferase